MRINRYTSLIVGLLTVASIFAQTPDLVLQQNIDSDYVSYLNSKETEWEAQVAIGGDDAPTMKAYIGLAALSFAWTHIDADTAYTDFEVLADSIEGNLDSLITRLEDDIFSMLDPWEMNALLTNLTDFFNNGNYVAFRDFMENMNEKLAYNFEDLELILENLGQDIEDNFTINDFGHGIDSVYNHQADFEFSMQILAKGIPDSVFIIDRNYFDHIHDLEWLGDSLGTHLEFVAEFMDSVMNSNNVDIMPAVDTLRLGLSMMTELLDTVDVILSSQPFMPFDIDTAPIDSLQEFIAELDTLLGGKEYPFGPEAEGKTIKPLALIQLLPDGEFIDYYWEFYRDPNPTTFTFGGIFPNGLDAQTLDLLSADMVVNDWDDETALENKLSSLKVAWQDSLLLTPDDPDAHFGLAAIMGYDMVKEYSETFEDIVALLDSGRIDSIAYLYDWEDVDIFADLDEIDTHLSYFTEADDPTHFIVLIKTQTDSFGPYIIGPGSEFEMVHIPRVAVATLQMEMELLRGAAELIVDGLTEVYAELEDVFVLNLDPSFLDFSNVEDDMDLILMLESSNPNFLTLTDYGAEQFIQMGDDLEEAMFNMHEFFDLMAGLARAMQPYEGDFDMDGLSFIADMEEMEERTFSAWQDFAIPDSMMWIDDERVNFSAWFDKPPSSFLLMWRGEVFGNDQTWGGLFPDRYIVDIIPEDAGLPKDFVLHEAYPNPFNPVTNIRFDLPVDGMVTIRIFNIRGQLVETLVQEEMSAGRHVIPWVPGSMPSNLYLYQVQYDGQTRTNKVLLIK